MRGSVSGGLATMGCALPYATGAKFAHPDRPVVALVGDGAMQMNGLEPDRVRSAWEQALAADRPCVLEFVTDASIPPIPPHATPEQAEKTAQALLRDDPDAWGVLKEGIKSKAQEFLPGRRRGGPERGRRGG